MQLKTTLQKPSHQAGISLIEQMISLTLGLLIIAGVLGVFTANRETARSTEKLARIQENVRAAFDLMGRSLREAGSNPCGLMPGAIGIAPGVGNAWWTGGTHFEHALKGYEEGKNFPANGSGSNAVTMASKSDALILVSGTTTATTVFTDNFPTGPLTGQYLMGYASNDILLGCNQRAGTIFRATAVAKRPTANHPESGDIVFSWPMTHPITTVSRLNAEGWFVGTNAMGGSSLFRTYFNSPPEEIATDVTDMQLSYLMREASSYVDADSVDDDKWHEVVAILIEIKVASASGTGAKDIITRSISHTVTLRNRSTTP